MTPTVRKLTLCTLSLLTLAEMPRIDQLLKEKAIPLGINSITVSKTGWGSVLSASVKRRNAL